MVDGGHYYFIIISLLKDGLGQYVGLRRSLILLLFNSCLYRTGGWGLRVNFF